MSETVLVTGGAGYIGSHVVLLFLRNGYDVCVLDDFSSSDPTSLERVEKLAGRSVRLYRGDIRDRLRLTQIFAERKIHGVLHFAGLKSVNGSIEAPEEYYSVNVMGSLAIIENVLINGVGKMIFSSSATVYGDASRSPLDEAAPTAPVNPYGKTKLAVETMLADITAAHRGLRAISLRYFNPVGADESGEIGEDPKGTPANLFPFIAQVAAGTIDKVRVFGSDWDTRDGTGVRDYIHVSDLAKGHLAAYRKLDEGGDGHRVVNLGTGIGTSVLEAIRAFSEAAGEDIAYEVVDRRPGDIAECYTDGTLARDLLGWSPAKTLSDMCADHWRWQKNGTSD